MRAVAWRVSARAGQLLTSQRAAPTPLRTWVAPLVGGAGPEQVERAVVLTSALVGLAVRNGIDVGLVAPESGVLIPPIRSHRAVDRILDELGALRAAGGFDGEMLDRIPAKDRVIVVHAGDIRRDAIRRPCSHFSGEKLESLVTDAEALRRFDAMLAWMAGKPLTTKIVDQGASLLDDLLSPLPKEAM
jgi:uncharacterized protein (DUF58 family)